MSITLELPPELEHQVEQAARTQGKDVPTFLVDSLRLRLRPVILPEPESVLLHAINSEIAPAARRQRDILIASQKERELTAHERDQLSRLMNEVELGNAKRWQAIAQLAALRGVSLTEIAAQLEIPLD